MRLVLIGLELVSHGGTQAWNPSGGQSGEPDDKIVGQVTRSQDYPHLKWRAIYAVQATEMGREAVIQDAKRELESWTKRTAPRVEGKSLVELILEDGEGWEPRVVAQRYGVDEGFVRRKRMHANPPRGTEDGRKILPDDETTSDQTTAVAALRRRGLSQNEIAKTLGISQPTVSRLLKEARFRRSAA